MRASQCVRLRQGGWSLNEIAGAKMSHVRDSFGAWPILQLAVMQGEFKRGDASDNTDYAERQARTALNQLIDKGYLVSPTTRRPVRLGFPPDAVDRWFLDFYYLGPSSPAWGLDVSPSSDH